jgi:hypothetical protein
MDILVEISQILSVQIKSDTLNYIFPRSYSILYSGAEFDPY